MPCCYHCTLRLSPLSVTYKQCSHSRGHTMRPALLCMPSCPYHCMLHSLPVPRPRTQPPLAGSSPARCCLSLHVAASQLNFTRAQASYIAISKTRSTTAHLKPATPPLNSAAFRCMLLLPPVCSYVISISLTRAQASYAATSCS
jgi:hypothetical protein